MTKEKGNIAESQTLAYLVSNGISVLQPFGDNEPYDLVVEVDKGFTKLQVKTAHYDSGSVKCKSLRRTNMTSSGVNHTEYSGSEVDVYALYCVELDEVYGVPFEEAGGAAVALRVDEEGSQYAHNLKWADDYELSSILMQ